MTRAAEVLTILGQTAPKNQPPERRALELVRGGLPASVLKRLAELFGVSVLDIQLLVGLSKATGTRTRGKAAPLKALASDRAYRLASVLAFARDVFGDDENAREWFKDPIPALRGARPLDLLDTEVGTQEVIRVLGRIQHGVYS